MRKSLILIFGPNGSGKGTLAKGLVNKINGFVHINSGQCLREWANFTNNLKVIEQINSGVLVKDTIIRKALLSKFKNIKDNVILEGFPRKPTQIKILKEILKKYNYQITYIFNLFLPLEEILERIKYRVYDEYGNVYNLLYNPPLTSNKQLYSRKDDEIEIAIQRFNDFLKFTIPCISNELFLNTNMFTINASKSIDEILAIALKKLGHN